MTIDFWVGKTHNRLIDQNIYRMRNRGSVRSITS